MRAAQRALAPALVVALVALAATRARGDAATEARYFDERARAEFAREHYDQALVLFLHVHAVAPTPGNLYNIGVSAALAHQGPIAYAHFDEFVRSGAADGDRRADAERRMAELERDLARVHVESDPPGATIWVDRRELGEWGRSPRTLVLEPGAHEIELELGGHVSARSQVTAERGRQVDVRATLDREHGELRVEVVPATATVTATERPGGTEHALRPGETARVPTGGYDVRAEAEGHRPDERAVTVRAGALETVRLAPAPIPPRTGRVLVGTGSIAAQVSIDGTPRGTTPARIDGVTEGTHAIEIRAEGYRPWRGEVVVSPDRGAFVDVTLVRER